MGFGLSLSWPSLSFFRRKSPQPSHENPLIVNQIYNNRKSVEEEEEDNKDHTKEQAEPAPKIECLSDEDIAAIKIQSFFRGFLARQALRALRSLVKLQALVRGVQVRRQSRIALHCMHALVQLHVTIQARQLLTGEHGR